MADSKESAVGDAAKTPESSVGRSGVVDLGEIKRGKGRPKGSKNKPKNEGSPSVRENRPAIDPTCFVETVIAVIEITDDVLRARLITEIRKRIPEKEKDVREMLAKAAFNEKDKHMLTIALNQLVIKYDFLAKFGPEFLLGIWALQYSVRMGSLFRMVKSYPEQKNVTPGEHTT